MRRNLSLSKIPLEKINDIHKPSPVHVLGDFNFGGDIVWPDRLNKSGAPLSPSEGEKFIEIKNDRHLEQLVITSLQGKFLDIQSPDRLSDNDIVSGTLKVVIPPLRNIEGRYIVIRRVAMNL